MCLLRAPSGGKLKRRAVGPYTFLRYVGWRGVNAEIAGASGTRLTVSAANLHPMDPRTHVDQYTRRVEQGQPQEETRASSPTSGSSISDPPGVWVHPLQAPEQDAELHGLVAELTWDFDAVSRGG